MFLNVNAYMKIPPSVLHLKAEEGKSENISFLLFKSYG